MCINHRVEFLSVVLWGMLILNLLGCNKENFKKLLKNMNYKITEKKENVYFRYSPKKVFKKTFDKKDKKESPFGILKDLQLN